MSATLSIPTAPAREVGIALGPVVLEATLAVPDGARALVVLAADAPGARRTPRIADTAALLAEAGLATLAADLAAPHEEEAPDLRTLTARLLGVTDWLRGDLELRGLRIGYLGVGTGSAAALVAASARPHTVRAVVCLDRRPDLAGHALSRVRAPVLLLCGAEGELAMDCCRAALSALRSEKRMGTVPGARFEEPASLALAGEAAAEWLEAYLVHGVHAPDPAAVTGGWMQL